MAERSVGLNAALVEPLPGRGPLSVRPPAAPVATRGGWLTLTTSAEGDTVVVEVSDTGVGIKREDIKRIYDPFFTTKGIGRGTGLGLSVSYGIVQEHGGAIFVDSVPGQGTTFQVALPALAPAEAAREVR